MFTVSIDVNARPVYARSCRNTGRKKGDRTIYQVDTGEQILHDPADGAVELARKLLNTIEDV